jgi:Icc protein
MRLGWITDPHLNFLPPSGPREFGRYLATELPDIDQLIVTGDIAEAPSVRHCLNEFALGFGKRIAFILGNHDFYKGSIEDVYKEMAEVHLEQPNLVWLDTADPILLDDETALVGNQGWYDGILGKAEASRVLMSDFELIQDFRQHYQPMYWLHYAAQGSRSDLLAKLQALSRHCASEAKHRLVAALKLRKTVIFATHYPPFKKACWHEGNISNDHWLPWFTSGAMGHMLGQVAADHPDHRILILCGHTHSPGVYQTKNMRVLTGRAVYGAPDISGLFETPLGDWKKLRPFGLK